MLCETTIDICHICKNEKEGFYVGESDNVIFLCEDCQNDLISEVIEYNF